MLSSTFATARSVGRVTDFAKVSQSAFATICFSAGFSDQLDQVWNEDDKLVQFPAFIVGRKIKTSSLIQRHVYYRVDHTKALRLYLIYNFTVLLEKLLKITQDSSSLMLAEPL